nr:MAG TPA: hypothetical protein [Caudoviricetes sp.]
MADTYRHSGWLAGMVYQQSDKEHPYSERSA